MSDNFKYVQAQDFQLNGAGAIAGATTIVLQSFTQIDGTTLLTMTDFGTVGFATIEPGNGILEEQISFTGVTQNANGTATLTGVSTVLFVSPYTATSGLARTHAGSTSLIISNTAGFYDKFLGKANDETITGLWTFPSGASNPALSSYSAPTTDVQLAAKKYVDDSVTAGAPDASTTTKGITKLDTAPSSPTAPIAVGVNSLLVAPATGTSGGILGFTSTTVRASSVLLTNHALIVGGGAGATPTPLASLGTSSTVLHGAAAGDPTWGAVSLTADVSGTLPVANGGTGVTSFSLTWKNGVTTRAADTASGSQTIAHGLGRTPIKVRMTVNLSQAAATGLATSRVAYSFGSYDGTNTNSVYSSPSIEGGQSALAGNDSTYIIFISYNTSGGVIGQKATVAVDGTNITLTWTMVSSGAGSNNMNILWEVF
jgi:hypothetical protein